MHNDNKTAGTEQVSQHQVEAILKLANSGLSLDGISSFCMLSAQMVQQVIANDPIQRARVVESIKEKSRKFRCAQSNRLMISPVLALGKNYEQCILEAHPSLSSEQALPNLMLKDEIVEFSKESLRQLGEYLRQKHPQEDILELTAECLSVLSHDAGMLSIFRVLGAVEGDTVKKLIRKLRGLVPEQMLLSLMNQRELPVHALCISALIILEPLSKISFDDAFRCFVEILSQVDMGSGAIDLAEEVSERLSSSQLNQINAALAIGPIEDGDRLVGLRLREAYALLREGKVEAATSLVSTLRISPRWEREVLRFYDEAGLSSGMVPILEHRLSAKLEEISRDSPSLAETLSILNQLHKAELQSRYSETPAQSLLSLKAEILNEAMARLGQQASYALTAQDAQIRRLEEQTQKKEADYQETLASLRAKVEAFTEDFRKAGEATLRVKRDQDARIQRSEEATQESLISLREELRVWYEQTARSGEQAKQIQSLIEQSQSAERATQLLISSFREEVLSKDLAQVATQCKQAQLAQDAKLEGVAAQSEKTEADVLKLNRELVDTKHLLQATREALNHLHEDTLPSFIYSYEYDTDQLHRTNLATGEQSSHEVSSHTFKWGCCWSEVLGGSLLITGGGYPAATREVVRIDVGTFEVTPQPHMLTPRRWHAAVHHTQQLYVLGGHNDRELRECERYLAAENRWEPLPPLPRACRSASGVVVERSLYALGGHDGSPLDLVQKLSLESFTWELMQLRLPHAGCSISCFKLRDTDVYLVVNATLCCFTGPQVYPLKTLTTSIHGWCGPSYYSRGTLYSSDDEGAVRTLEIGSLRH
jgi:hypothetical protein